MPPRQPRMARRPRPRVFALPTRHGKIGAEAVSAIRKFPYLVLFRIRGETVHLLAVFHSATNPAKWRQRTDLE